MTTGEATFWYAALVVGTIGSALFSGLETGCYTINRVRLHVLAHVPGSNAARLEKLIEQPNRLLGTLLVGNNMVNYLASMAVAALLTAAGYSDWSQVAVSAAILTPLLLIFGEVLPKDLFRSYGNVLAPPFARPLNGFATLLTWTGVLPLIGLVSVGLRRRLADPRAAATMMHPHRIVTNLIREGVGHGVISVYQSSMIDRVLETRSMTAREVMIPWSKVTAARVNQPPEAIWALADRVAFARIPLVDAAGQPVGCIDLNDVLRHDPAACPPLESFVQPVTRVAPDVSLLAALRQMQRARASLALVIERDRPIGLITAKDLVEPIVGDIEVW